MIASLTVDVLPECDVHRQVFVAAVPAEFDAPLVNVPGQPGAYLCATCLPKWGPGEGSALVQRLIVGGAV
jgi:hypothetical protein